MKTHIHSGRFHLFVSSLEGNRKPGWCDLEKRGKSSGGFYRGLWSCCGSFQAHGYQGHRVLLSCLYSWWGMHTEILSAVRCGPILVNCVQGPVSYKHLTLWVFASHPSQLLTCGWKLTKGPAPLADFDLWVLAKPLKPLATFFRKLRRYWQTLRALLSLFASRFRNWPQQVSIDLTSTLTAYLTQYTTLVHQGKGTEYPR